MDYDAILEQAVALLRQGMATTLGTGQTLARPFCLVLPAEAAGHADQVADGLRLLAEAVTMLEANGQGDLLAEAYRLQGAVLLRQATPNVAQAADRTGDFTTVINAPCLRERRRSGGAHAWRRRGAQPNHSGWCAVASKRSLVLKRS